MNELKGCRAKRVVLLCIAVFALAACGGGGGSGGGGTTTPPPPSSSQPPATDPSPPSSQPPATDPPPTTGNNTPATGEFTLETDKVAFTAVQLSTVPSAKTVAINITGSGVGAVGAAYTNGQTKPDWLGINITGSGTRYSLVLSILSTSLSPGDYSTTFSVGTADSGGTILHSSSVTVSYTVSAPPVPPGDFTLAAQQVVFNAEANAPPPASSIVAIAVKGPGVDHLDVVAADKQPLPDWLHAEITGSAANYSLALSIAHTNLGVGSYSRALTVRTLDSSGKVLQPQGITVVLNIAAPLVDGGFALSASQVSFTAVSGATIPASKTVVLSQRGSAVASMTATVLTGNSWLSAALSGDTLTLAVSASSSFGVLSGVVTVSSRDAKGNVLQSRSVNVTYTIEPHIAITGSSTTHSFTFGHPVSTQGHALNISATLGRTWKLSSNQSWLRVPTATRTGSDSVDAVVDVATLTPGSYQAQITVTNANDPLDTAVHAVKVDVVKPALTVLQNAVLLGGTDGLSSSPASVSFDLNTSTSTYPFTITLTTDDGASWLKSDVSSGVVGASGAGVQLTTDGPNLKGGTYTGQIRVAVDVHGVTVSDVLPVTFNKEANRILVDAAGVAFTSLPAPARSVLTRQVKVLSTLQKTNTAWQATSDHSWLTVTASGTTGGALTLTANPAGLATNTTHFASVTIKSSDTAVENQETIRVGLYVGSAVPTTFALGLTASYLATSPVEPLVFVSDGSGNVKAYNVFTGTQARDFPGIVAAAGTMTLSDDGQQLFVYDTTNLRVVQVNATTGAFVRSYDSSAMYSQTPYGGGLAFFRPDAYPVLITPSSRMYDVSGTAMYLLPNFNVPLYAFSLDASSDNRYIVETSGSVYRMKRTALNGGAIAADFMFNTATAEGREGQACISQDVSMVYTASGAPYDFPGTSFATHQVTQRLPGTAYPNAILCLWNGAVIGGIDGYYESTDIWVYNGPTGVELAKLSSSTQGTYRSLRERGLAASGDASRLISISGSYSSTVGEVKFQSIPGP
jgi:hypothetical protein